MNILLYSSIIVYVYIFNKYKKYVINLNNTFMGNTIYSKENRELIDVVAAERSKNTVKQCNISEMESLTVEDKNGNIRTFNPRKIASWCKQFLDMMRTNKDTQWLAPFISKNIIWTTECKTFFTDGIRIAANPYFAAVLINHGMKEARQKMSEISASNKYDFNGEREIEREYISKYFQYVIVHEAYHMVYQHIRRSLLKIGKGNEYEHSIANIAMDMEINRDIEAQYQKYSGATKTLEGIWYEDYINKHTGKPFAKEIWEDIYDYLMENPDQVPENKQQIEEGNLPPFQPPKWPYKDGWDKAIDAIRTNKIKL